MISERIIPVDIDAVMHDEALTAMPDGPAKRLLTRLAFAMDHDADEAVPMLVVRRDHQGEFNPNARPA